MAQFSGFCELFDRAWQMYKVSKHMLRIYPQVLSSVVYTLVCSRIGKTPAYYSSTFLKVWTQEEEEDIWTRKFSVCLPYHLCVPTNLLIFRAKRTSGILLGGSLSLLNPHISRVHNHRKWAWNHTLCFRFRQPRSNKTKHEDGLSCCPSFEAETQGGSWVVG